MKKLVIVESPSKSKTIEKYLGPDYKVLSSKGHIRDLAKTGKYGLGVDLEDNYRPNYVNIKLKKKVIDELKKESKNCDEVILATDPDREGEAISFHLFETLNLEENKYNRVVFNEITKSAIQEAFKNPRKIDYNLVHSQEARRILDRIIGFRLSKLMQSKTPGAKSAGRVQSVALKLIVDLEREIEKFISDEYWTITSKFDEFNASLEKYNNKNIEIKNEEEANNILNNLNNKFIIDSIDTRETKKNSKLPFYTSTLTQAASTKLNFSASKTMKIAQKLYEGIDIGNETVGLISYMRTDSTRLSEDFTKSVFAHINKNYGKEYLGFVKNKKAGDNVQDAHEAIRPTSIDRLPENIKDYLTNDEFKLYKFIFYRTLSSLMAPAKVDKTSVTLSNNDYLFKTTGQIYTFDGYLKVYKEYEDTNDIILPDFSKYKNGEIDCVETIKEQHFTEPPARFTEAKLIKELEKLGIGRPSTYTTIIDVLKLRNYIEIKDKKFFPTEIGIKLTDKLQKFFNTIINVEYTSDMESNLDSVAEGKKEWNKIVDDFYKKFEKLLERAFNDMEKEQPKTTGEVCPVCGKELVVRYGKFGEFTACSGFPECKYIKKEEQEIKEICDCPKCDGKIIERKTRKGKTFYGCSNYPKCKYALWDKPLNEKCPSCGEMLIDKKGETVCSVCDYKK